MVTYNLDSGKLFLKYRIPKKFQLYKLYNLNYNMEINEEIINNLIEKIKQNKKYKNLSEEIIKKEILFYLKSSQIKINGKTLKKQEIKSVVKGIRAKLHRIYASYQTRGKRKRNELLIELENLVKQESGKSEKSSFLEIINKLLSTTLPLTCVTPSLRITSISLPFLIFSKSFSKTIKSNILFIFDYLTDNDPIISKS